MNGDLTIGEVGRICTEIKADVKELDAKVDNMTERLAVLEATRPGVAGGKLVTAGGALGAGVAMVGEWLWTKLWSGHGP